MKFTTTSTKSSVIGYFLIIIVFILLALSLNVGIRNFDITYQQIIQLLDDLLHSFLRVSLSSLTAWICGILVGYFLSHYLKISSLFLPLINFIRHISAFAWLPFAIIWFGLGEPPIAFVMFISLFFPAIIGAIDSFEQIQPEYIEEAKVNGANNWQILKFIEIPLSITNFINLFRILWGLGWSVIIAAEMLGVNSGIGFRLLDFRYLLKYPQMIYYILTIGILGVVSDRWIKKLQLRVKTSLF